MKHFSWKFRRMPDSDKAPDDDKLLPGYVILREHFFTGPKEAGAVGRHPLDLQECLQTSFLCNPEGPARHPLPLPVAHWPWWQILNSDWHPSAQYRECSVSKSLKKHNHPGCRFVSSFTLSELCRITWKTNKQIQQITGVRSLAQEILSSRVCSEEFPTAWLLLFIYPHRMYSYTVSSGSLASCPRSHSCRGGQLQFALGVF